MVHVTLRLPRHLHKKLIEVSKQNNRSMHGQILYYIQRMIKTDESQGFDGQKVRRMESSYKA
jgi:hypothetical protein